MRKFLILKTISRRFFHSFQDGMPLAALTNQAIEEDSIDPEMIAIFAAKTTAERLRVAWGMWRSARRMIERIVAAEHPELPKSEQDRIVAQRMSHGT